ncbi:uncharacterized protein [Argopecten irradians]|uniref:uncharacterized protein n=1 Tax=Argopecten irradians TaxID=31199 RepID=UPI003717BE82
MGSTWSDDSSVKTVNRNVKKIWKDGTGRTGDRSVGSHFNGWQTPVQSFAANERNLDVQLRENRCIGDYQISDDLWNKSCGVVDEISRVFHKTLTTVSAKHHPCLIFGDFVKQGSSREGLKVRDPDEFDMILPFTIEGVDIQSVPALDSSGEQIPAHVTLRVPEAQMGNVETDFKYDSFRRNNVFDRQGSDLYLNAKNFHTKVILSIMDTTISLIQNEIEAETENEPCSFTLTKASVFPPTYRFKIKIKSDDDFDDLLYGQQMFRRCQRESRDVVRFEGCYGEAWNLSNKVIEFDIVPGILLKTDLVSNPDSWIPMTCDRYAVMKWVHKERYTAEYSHPELMWRESSCGYEKHIIDIGQRDRNSLFILTACRIIKAYLDGMDRSSQLRSLMTSYHIKNITIHCLLFKLQVSGVKEALGYLIGFLETSIDARFLPHYFYGNPNVISMFKVLSGFEKEKRLNLFRDISETHFIQAAMSLQRMKADLQGLFTELSQLRDQGCIEAFRQFCTLYPEDRSDKCILM